MHAGFCVCVCVCVFVNGDDLYFYSPNLFIIACSYLDEIGLLYLLGIVNEWQENNCRPIDCGLCVLFSCFPCHRKSHPKGCDLLDN